MQRILKGNFNSCERKVLVCMKIKSTRFVLLSEYVKILHKFWSWREPIKRNCSKSSVLSCQLSIQSALVSTQINDNSRCLQVEKILLLKKTKGWYKGKKNSTRSKTENLSSQISNNEVQKAAVLDHFL